MPHINISLYEGRTAEQKEEICQKLHQSAVESLGFPENSVSVSITEHKAEKFISDVQEHIQEGELFITSKVIESQG